MMLRASSSANDMQVDLSLVRGEAAENEAVDHAGVSAAGRHFGQRSEFALCCAFRVSRSNRRCNYVGRCGGRRKFRDDDANRRWNWHLPPI